MEELIRTLIPDHGTLIAWLIQALLAVGLITLVSTALAALLGNVPFVGPFLGKLVLHLGNRYQDWLLKQVPASAERAVDTIEEKFLGQKGQSKAKFDEAIQQLRSDQPLLSVQEATNQVHAALTRRRGFEAKKEDVWTTLSKE